MIPLLQWDYRFSRLRARVSRHLLSPPTVLTFIKSVRLPPYGTARILLFIVNKRMFLVKYFFRFDSSSCSCFSCCRWSCLSWRSSCHRYANWSPRSNASGYDDGAAWSTSTIAFVSIRRFHSTRAMTTTKVAHIIGTAGFRSIKISRQSFRLVKGPRSRTCRHPLWRVELSPSEVKVGHGGGVRRVCRLKLDDWKL